MDFFLSPQRCFRAVFVRFHRSRCPHRSPPQQLTQIYPSIGL